MIFLNYVYIKILQVKVFEIYFTMCESRQFEDKVENFDF